MQVCARACVCVCVSRSDPYHHHYHTHVRTLSRTLFPCIHMRTHMHAVSFECCCLAFLSSHVRPNVACSGLCALVRVPLDMLVQQKDIERITGGGADAAQKEEPQVQRIGFTGKDSRDSQPQKESNHRPVAQADAGQKLKASDHKRAPEPHAAHQKQKHLVAKAGPPKQDAHKGAPNHEDAANAGAGAGTRGGADNTVDLKQVTRGVHPDKLALYTQAGDFKCINGK